MGHDVRSTVIYIVLEGERTDQHTVHIAKREVFKSPTLWLGLLKRGHDVKSSVIYIILERESTN